MKKRIAIFLLACLLTVFTAVIPAAALDTQVYDHYGLLSSSDDIELNHDAVLISQEQNCGIYVVIVDRWQDYGGVDVLDCARTLYDSYDMGYGSGKDGILLLLSMDERDYALFTIGSYAESVFSDYALQVLESEFLDDLANDDWAGGISDYIETCGYILQDDLSVDDYIAYPDDSYIEEPAWVEEKAFSLSTLVVIIFIPCAIALIVCLILKAQLKSVHNPSADAYVGPEGLHLRIREDRFLYNTVTRRRIDTSSSSGRSSGGGSRSSIGGGSRGGGRSGKF